MENRESTFEQNSYPGKLKILFVGNPTSSHVQGWINLLANAPINVRLFSSAEGYPPDDWHVKAYLTTKYPPQGLDPNWRQSWWPIPEEWYRYDEVVRTAIQKETIREEQIREVNRWEAEAQETQRKYFERLVCFVNEYKSWKTRFTEFSSLIHHYDGKTLAKQTPTSVFPKLKPIIFVLEVFKKILKIKPAIPKHLLIQGIDDLLKQLPDIPTKSSIRPRLPVPPPSFFPVAPPISKTPSPKSWLAEVIQTWKPDIIHTFGLDTGSIFYYETRKEFGLEGIGKWVIKIFGGSDLAFSLYQPDFRTVMASMFSDCSQVIFDNEHYKNLVVSEGLLDETKVSAISPLPGSGGIPVDDLLAQWTGPTSSRRIIIWPKSYETTWSKAVPVLLALRNVWDVIQPCDLYMLTANDEIKKWISTLPDEMKEHLHVFEGVPRQKVLEIMLSSRVMLSPSLIDGIPNTMYEAMACGSIPIVSPLVTIKEVVNEENVIFANNLDQSCIEQAIIKAMKDDVFVDECAKRNVSLVKQLADSEKIRETVKTYYLALSA